MKSRPFSSFWSFLWTLLPMVVLGLGLGLTYVAWQGAQGFGDQAGRQHFETLVREGEAALTARAGLYEQALQGGAGFLAATPSVSRADWAQYVAAQDIKRNYPALLGLGVIDHVSAADLPAYLERVRSSGAPDFINFPTTDSDEKYIIRYVEPAADNMAAIGFDIAFEENRRAAAIKALATERMVITRKVELVQDSAKRPAFLLLLRVPGESAEEGKWVYAPVLAQPFLTGFETGNGNELSVEIYDGADRQPANLLYRSAATPAAPSDYNRQSTVTIGATSWTLVWQASSSFAPPVHGDLAQTILYAGAGLSVLLALLVQLPVSGMRGLRRRAQAHVQELMEARDFAEKIIDAIPDPLYVKNDRFEIILANQAFAALCPEGIPEDSEDDQARFGTKDEMALKRGQVRFDEDMTLPGGRVAKMHTSKVSFADPHGVSHILAIMRETGGVSAKPAAEEKTVSKSAPEDVPEKKDTGIIQADKVEPPKPAEPVKEPEPVPTPVPERSVEVTPVPALAPVPEKVAPLEKPESVEKSPVPETPPAAVVKASAPEIKKTGSRSLHILLAEDTPINQDVTRAMLESHGHRVTIAKNGRDAVTAAGNEVFDLVLMDILMPVMGGVQASREIRTTLEISAQALPILALTAHATAQDAATFRSAGIDDYLFKPVQKDDLIARIHKLMGWESDGGGAVVTSPAKTEAVAPIPPPAPEGDKTAAPDAPPPEDVDLDDFGEMDLYDLPDDMYDDDMLEDDLEDGNTMTKDDSAAQPAKPQSPLLDYAQHQGLVDTIGQDKQLEIYDHFKTDVEERFEIISRKGLDRERINANLHAMASMSGNLGLSKLSAECRRIMDGLPDLSEDQIQDEIVKLELLYKDSCGDYERDFC